MDGIVSFPFTRGKGLSWKEIIPTTLKQLEIDKVPGGFIADTLFQRLGRDSPLGVHLSRIWREMFAGRMSAAEWNMFATLQPWNGVEEATNTLTSNTSRAQFLANDIAHANRVDQGEEPLDPEILTWLRVDDRPSAVRKVERLKGGFRTKPDPQEETEESSVLFRLIDPDRQLPHKNGTDLHRQFNTLYSEQQTSQTSPPDHATQFNEEQAHSNVGWDCGKGDEKADRETLIAQLSDISDDNLKIQLANALVLFNQTRAQRLHPASNCHDEELLGVRARKTFVKRYGDGASHQGRLPIGIFVYSRIIYTCRDSLQVFQA